MTSPSIRVSADVSAVTGELQKVQAAAAKINQTLSSGQVGIDAREAKSDLAALESSASSLSKMLERVRSSGEDLSGVDFGAVTGALEDAAKAATQLDQVLDAVGQSSGMSATVRGAKQTAEHIQRAVKAQEILGRDGVRISRQQAESAKRQFDQWRQSGARGTSRLRNQEFDEWLSGGWRNYSMDEGDARRHRARVLDSVGVRSPQRGGTGGGPGGSPRIPGRMTGRLGAAAGALGGMAGSMTGGGDGGMFGAAGSAGGSLIGAGVGMLAGGPLGAVVGMFASRLLGGIGGSLDQGIDRSRGEGGDLTDLRQSVGATKVDFDLLRGSVRYFADGLGLTYNEAAKLARSFAHTANLQDAQSVGREVGSAAGFARGYGMDPSASVNFFATMRHFGLSSGDRDNRKLALQIGEAVQRGGTSAKMDEVLASIQSFVQTSSRQSMTQANAEAYASFMSSMTGLSMPGVKGDPQSAAAAMAAADAAMRQGGAFGEASKNFSLGLWQRQLGGFNALDMDYINEQGAFGSVGRAFGRDSAAYKFAESRGDSAKMAQYDKWSAQGGDTSIMAMQMQALDQQFGGNTDEFRKSIMSHFGVGAGQASALYQAYQNDRGLGSLEESLRAAGVPLDRLNTKQIASLAPLAQAGDGDIRKQAARLLGLGGANALGVADKGSLEQAMSGTDKDALRKKVLELTATYDSAGDQGELMRKQQADMSNAMQELATKLIPLTIAVKDGIIELVRYFSPDSAFVKAQDEERAKLLKKEKDASVLDSQMSSVKRQIDEFKPADPLDQQRRAQVIVQQTKLRDEALARGDKAGAAQHEAVRSATEAALRAGSPVGKKDLIDRYNGLASQRNAIDGVPGGVRSPLDSGGAETAPSASVSGGKGPRNLRNNNPGNIEYGDFARRHGAVGSDGRFAIFPDRQTGTAAMDALLQSYGGRGLDTVSEIVGRWAPPGENDTGRYAAFVAKRLGVGVNDQLDMKDPKVRAEIGKAKAAFEGSAQAYFDGKAPAGAVGPSSGSRGLSGTVSGEIVVVTPDGQRTGQTVPVSGRFGAPVSYGVQG